ncbi:MAG: NADH-quinone oxidoreductase subunit M [Candidatus Dasytiphilus stammeri]
MLLPLLIIIPFISGLLCWQSERLGAQFPRWIALIALGIILTLSLQILLRNYYNLTPLTLELSQWYSEYSIAWIPGLGINFNLAIDGLSIIMVILSGIMGIMAVLCSWSEINESPGGFHLNLLWILCGVIGIFIATDLFLFFVFWEIMLVPMYFLIALWGHKGSLEDTRINAAIKFFIYTQISGLIMLITIISLVLIHYSNTGILTFSYQQLLHTTMSPTTEYLLMLGFFIALSVKFPIVPLHGWLLDAHSQSPTAGSVELAGIVLKTAAYGLLRFGIPLFPNASIKFAPLAMWFGIINIFYGALMAFSQTDMKRFIAYTSISHMGLILIAIYTGNQLAYHGAVIQMIAHGISAAGLFILCGQLYERLQTRNMCQIEGLWATLNYMPAFALFFALATMGMPGTGNFIGEFLILLGNYQIAPIIAILATLSIILATVYSLIMIQRIFFGTTKPIHQLKEMTLREKFSMLFLILLLILLCFIPQPVLKISSSTTLMNII